MPSFLQKRKAKWLWRAGAHAVAQKKRQGEPCLSRRVLVGLAEYSGQSLIYGIGDEIDIFRRTNQSG